MFTNNYFMPVFFVPKQDGPQPAQVLPELLEGYRAVQAARSSAQPKAPTSTTSKSGK